MNTTQRILANGGRHTGCHEFLKTIFKNNPISGSHWIACLTNNPDGIMPNNNPTEFEETITSLSGLALVS